MTASADNPGVVVRPPFLYGGAFIVVLVLGRFWPMPILGETLTPWLGVVVIVLGVAIVGAGRRVMQAAGTNVNPSKPATTIVASGPFRFSRNPLYVGLTLVYSGLTLAFNTWWGFVLLAPILVTMHLGVVLREERYLEQKFGEPYRQYRSSVRRYL